MYFALVHSHLLEGTLSWGIATNINLSRLNLLHRNVLRNIYFKYTDTNLEISNRDLHFSLQIHNIKDIYKTELGMYMYRITNDIAYEPF